MKWLRMLLLSETFRKPRKKTSIDSSSIKQRREGKML
jgi:hypothetical protein